MITIEIDKFLIDREYINLFVQIYIQWSKDEGSTSSSRTLIIPRLPHFEKLTLSQIQLYIETKTMTQCFVCHNFQIIFPFDLLKAKRKFFNFTHVKDT